MFKVRYAIILCFPGITVLCFVWFFKFCWNVSNGSVSLLAKVEKENNV